MQNSRPLAVDLDGTLIYTDLLLESCILLLRDRPLLVLALPYWLMQGKAVLKERLAHHVKVDISSLPFNDVLIDWLRSQRDAGRYLILCTASNLLIARAVEEHIHLFDEVLASDKKINLAGKNKAHALIERFGIHGFDYVGNSNADLHIWGVSRKGVVINGSNNLIGKAASLTEVEYAMTGRVINLKVWIKTLRLHQWIKNGLIFVPILAAHQVITVSNILDLFYAFISFSFCASSVYIANDLLDLESDRRHPRKRHRPFASGHLPIWAGLALAPFLIVVSLMVGGQVGGKFLPWLSIYFGLTCLYSWRLKRLVLVDCFTLAILYTLRIVAGAFAVDVPLSFWLLAFSIFIFLSLAFVKRYAELKMYSDNGIDKAHGRGYQLSDAILVQQLGVSSGFAATLVLALYLNSENVVRLYQNPEIIWGAVPLMLLWISWVWLQAARGFMHDDPIVFAIKDKSSLVIGTLFVAIFISARIS